MFCGNCGNELREGAKFCPKCGAMTRLARQQEQPPAEPEPVLEPEPVQEPAGIDVPTAESTIEGNTASVASTPREQAHQQRPAAGKVRPAVRLKAMPVEPAQDDQSASQAEPGKSSGPSPAPEPVELPQQPTASAQPSILEAGAARLASVVGNVKDALGGKSVQCGNCGAKLKAGAKFCPECGAFQGEIKQESQSSAQALASEDVKVVVKRISIIAVPAVVIVLALIIAMTMGGQQDSAASPTATPFSDTTSNSNELSTPTAMPTKEPSFTPPNGLPEGEIWNHVVRTESYGLISFEPYYVIPAYRCTQEILEDTLTEVSDSFSLDKLDDTFFNGDFDVADAANVFSAKGLTTLLIYAKAMHELWEVDISILTLESANVYSDFSNTIQFSYDGRRIDYPINEADAVFILGKSDNTHVIKANTPPSVSYMRDGERVSEIPYLTDDFFQIMRDAVSQPSFAIEDCEKTMIELYQNLIHWLMTNRPMKNSVPLNSIPTGQWVDTDAYYGGYYEPSINPDQQIYINSVDEGSITFTPTVTIHSELAAHNGETYTLETPIKAAVSRDDVHGELWGTFTYTDPWGNVFEGSLSQAGGDGALMIRSEMVAYGSEHQFTFGVSGNFLPVDSIID